MCAVSVILMEPINVNMTNSCILCRQKGAELYSDLSDRLFGTPGRFSLMRCATDGLVWLHPTASAHQQEKAYLSYYTHEVKQRTSALKTIKEAVTKSVLSERFGFHPRGPQSADMARCRRS